MTSKDSSKANSPQAEMGPWDAALDTLRQWDPENRPAPYPG